jgi:hypothetical protein
MLEALAEHLGQSKSATVELAVRQAARREGVARGGGSPRKR